MTTNFTFSERNAFGDDPEGMKWLDKMCREYIQVRPYLSLDMYPLTDADVSLYSWCAAQYHDPVSDSGVVLVYKREKSPFTDATFTLGGICPEKSYSIQDADGENNGASIKDGVLSLHIEGKRVAKVFFYK